MILRTFSSFASMQFRCGPNCAFTKWRNERSAHGIRAWQSPRNTAERSDETHCALSPSSSSRLQREDLRGTSALEEQAHDRELFAAYCMGVFGPDQTTLKSPSMPACLTNEPGRRVFAANRRHRPGTAARRSQSAAARRKIFGNTGRHCARSLHDACQVPRRNVVLGRPMTTAVLSRLRVGQSPANFKTEK